VRDRGGRFRAVLLPLGRYQVTATLSGFATDASPRGPIRIDPATRDIVQNIYIRKVEKVDGKLYTVEFQTFEAVKDAGKTKK